MTAPASPSGRQPGGDAVEDRRVDPVQIYAEMKSQPRSVRRLPRILARAVALTWRASPGLLVAVSALQVGGALLTGLQLLVGRQALAAVIGSDGSGDAVSRASGSLVLLAVATALSSVALTASVQLTRLLGDRVVRTTWGHLLDVTSEVDLAAFESPRFFDQLQRVQTNTLLRPLAVSQGLVGLLSGLAGAAAVAVALATVEPLLVPLLLVAGVPLWLLSRRGSRLEFSFVVEQTASVRERQYLTEVLTGREPAKEVRAFGLAPTLRKRYEDLYDVFVGDLTRHVLRRLRLAVAGTLATSVVTAATLVVLLVLVDRGRLTLAEAGAGAVAIRLLGSRLQQCAGGLGTLFESGLFLADLNTFLDLRPSRPEVERRPEAPPFASLVAEGVTFTYPGSPSAALRDVSLRIGAGEIVALVGENGSGKTTLAKLLGQLYQPGEGRILWAGEDAAGLDPASLRRQIAVIFQDFVRYQLSARVNVGAGRPEDLDDLDGIVRAAQQSGAHEFLERLPQGYDTMLGKAFAGGQDLSIGQWQRVALARAFFRQAPFIILDEPSAALDPRAESALFERIRSLAGGRTVLLISHRFSSVRTADRIYVMEHGRIIEEGDHDTLMAADGLYAELFTMQASAYLGSGPD